MIDKMQIWPWKKKPVKAPAVTLNGIGAEICNTLETARKHSASEAERIVRLNAELDEWWTKPRARA
jgi:hypothetical protein